MSFSRRRFIYFYILIDAFTPLISTAIIILSIITFLCNSLKTTASLLESIQR